MKNIFKHISKFAIVLIFIMGVFSCKFLGSSKKEQKIPEHPRLFLQTEDEEKLLELISGDNYAKELSRVIIEASDKIIDMEPLVYKKTGKRLLSVSRSCIKRVTYLSYSYRLTKDKKYLNRAEKEMLAISAFNNWNPSHFLDVAEMTAALGIGYDWLYHDLSDKSKTIIKNAIINNGLIPSKDNKYNSWLRGKNNWNQVCNGGLAIGAMAILESEPKLSQEIIDRALTSIQIPLKQYEPDGAYPEGNSYWAYGTMYHVLFIDAYRKIFGEDTNFGLANGFMNSGFYFLHVFGPTGSFNYSDGGSGFYLTPAIFWYAAELKDNSILFNQNKLLSKLVNDGGSVSEDRYLPFIPIWASRLENLEINTPKEKSWTGIGVNPVSFHRSSWDEDAIFIGIKGGSPSSNHAHMDIGSFVMDANGVRWAKDFGSHNYYSLESQGVDLWNRNQDSERWSIFRYSNYAHNTLTVNNELQKVDGHAVIIKNSDNEKFRNTVLDLSSAYAEYLENATRGIAIIDNDFVVVRDEIKNNESPANVRWAMLTHDNIEIVNDRLAIIKKDGKELKFMILEPENAKIQTYSTDPPNDFEDKNPNTVMIGFELDLKANEKQTLRVALVPGKNTVPDNFKSMKLADW